MKIRETQKAHFGLNCKNRETTQDERVWNITMREEAGTRWKDIRESVEAVEVRVRSG